MADTEDPEETSVTPQESDYEIPGIPDDSKLSTSGVSKTSPKMSKIESLVTTILQNSSPSASEVVPPPEDPPGDPSIQSHQEETSKSQEELQKSQELPLNGKQTSLDQLSKDMFQNGQKPRAARLHRQCQRRFRELIGKREMKNEELEKQQGDLKHRLNILECSMPAVMVWNIWRMSQGACVPSIKQVLEKSFQGPASGEVYCPSTPSRHFDCRVREVEAERKQAQKRAEEARTLWAEKAAALEERNKKLEEARKTQEQIKENIEKLKIEAQKLREAAAAKMKDDEACESGECGVIECKKKWLDKVPSSASIKSTDIECLEELQQLAETELCMKRQIADLERREEAYMRTLQQADELWSKLQGDAASTMSTLQEQLDVKTAANQQMADRIVQLEDMLEKLRTKMANCRNELEKYMSIGKIEALIGRDDDFADVVEQKTSAEVLQLDQKVGSKDDVATVEEKGVLSKEEVSEKDVLAKPDVADLITGVHRDDLIQIDDVHLVIKSEDVLREEQRLEEAKDYLASYGSLSELFTDDDYVCAPDFACNDQVFTETGLTEEELKALKEGRVTAEMLLKKLEEADGISNEGIVKADRVPGVMMRMIRHMEGRKETVEQPYEVGEEEIIAVDEITVDSDRKIDDEQESPVTTLKETEIDALQEAFIETPVPKEEIVEGMTTEAEVEDYTLYQDAVGDDSILVPRDELLTWQGNVDAVRETIAKCPDCLVVKNDADEVAEMIARYTGITMRDVIDDPRRKEEEVEELRVLEQVSPTEIEVQLEEKRRPKPEIEAEVITARPPKQEEVPPLVEEIAAPTIQKEIKDIEETKTAQKLPEVEAPAEKQKVARPTASVVQEVSKEPSKVSVPQVASVKGETPPRAKEEIPPLITEVAPVAAEIGPKKEKEHVEPVKTDTVPTAGKEDTVTPVDVVEVKKTPMAEKIEDGLPSKMEEVVKVEVVKEVAPPAEETKEVKQVVSAEEKEKDVDVSTIKEKEEPKVVEAEVFVEKKEEEAPVSREEETESRVLPEEDEMVTAQKKEIEDDLLPEVEEKKAPEEEKVEVDMIEVVEEPTEEEIVVELLPEKGEIPVSTEEEVALELIPEQEEEEMPADEEVASELLPEQEEEEMPAEQKEELELLPEKEEEEILKEEVIVESLPDEVPKEEEIEMEVLPEEEEVSEPKEEGEEEAKASALSSAEAEEPTVLVVAVIPEEEVEIEAEEAPVLDEEVEEVPIEEIIEIEEIVDEEKIEEVPEEEKVEMLPEEGEELAEEKEAEEEVIEVPVSEEVEICIEEICEGPCKEEVPAEEKESEEVIEVPVSDETEIPVEICMVGICKEEICLGKASIPEVPEVPAPEEAVSLPCVCFAEPEVPKDQEEMDILPCVCFSEAELEKVPDKEEAQTLPCVCFAESQIPKVPLQEEAPCDCFSIPEEPAPKASKAPVSEDPTKLCSCFFTLETPKAAAPKIPTPEVPLGIPFVSVLPPIAEQQTEPPKKIEITQTEFSRTMESVEVVTQTVSETGTQTPMNRFIRRSQQPKIITITKSVDPELEILDQLTRRLTPITEPSLTITTAASTQTEKSSFLQVKATCVDSRPPSLRISEILQSLKAEVAHLNAIPKSDQEQELKSFHYDKKPKQPELAKCNCCMCGKDVPSSISIDPRPQRQSSTVCCAQPTPPTTRKTIAPCTNQGVQYETICPECKIRKLQDALKSQESLRSPKKEAKKPTSDKEVSATASITPRGKPFHRLKKKVDQCCSAKISKASSKGSSKTNSMASSKMEKSLKSDKVDPEKEVQEIMPATKATDKESLMHCVCSCEIETEESGEFSRMHCACGDPD